MKKEIKEQLISAALENLSGLWRDSKIPLTITISQTDLNIAPWMHIQYDTTPEERELFSKANQNKFKRYNFEVGIDNSEATCDMLNELFGISQAGFARGFKVPKNKQRGDSVTFGFKYRVSISILYCPTSGAIVNNFSTQSRINEFREMFNGYFNTRLINNLAYQLTSTGFQPILSGK